MTEAERDVEPTMQSTYAGTTSSLFESRTAVAQVAARHGVDPTLIEALKLAVNELTTNAVTASPNRRYRVDLSVLGRSLLILTVANRQPTTSPPPVDEWRLSESLAERGRGLAIVQALANSVDVTATADGWIVITAELATRHAG